MRRNVLMAAAKDLPQLSLADAFELTVLVARKDPRRHPRVAARRLLRWLEEDPHATIEEAALATASLAGLTGVAHNKAVQTLRAMAERATGRRRARGVADGIWRSRGVGRQAVLLPRQDRRTLRRWSSPMPKRTRQTPGSGR